MSGSINLGIPDIAVVLRENTDTNNVVLDVPNISVTVERAPDYKVSVQPSSLVVQRTGSLPSIAVSAITSSYALSASYVAGGTISSASYAVYAITAGTTETASYALTASVAEGFDIIFAGEYQTGSTTPLVNGWSSLSASYASTASYINEIILAKTAPPTPKTGSVYFSNSFIYVYDGTQYRSASLN